MTAPPDGTSDDRWPRRVTLPGARTLSIRPVRPSDTDGLVALYAGLKDDDTYRRFFSGHAPPEDFVEKMTHVAERGGFGLIAAMEEENGTSRIVGEATYDLLPNGDAELGITVAEMARGWLGPYLLDALVTAAAARGVPNLEADVLVTNRRMLTMLRARGFAVDRSRPCRSSGSRSAPPSASPRGRGRTTVPGCSSRYPAGAGTPKRRLEQLGSRCWLARDPCSAGHTARPCDGEPCPLAAGADVIVDAVPDEPGRSLLEAHRRVHPSVPVCVELPSGESDLDAAVSTIPRGTSDTVVMGILERLAKEAPVRSAAAQWTRHSVDGRRRSSLGGGEVP